MKPSLDFRETSAHFPVNVKLELRLIQVANTHSKGNFGFAELRV